MIKIFMCYRRELEGGATTLIWDRLKDEFGPENVFLDVGGIYPGEDWEAGLRQQVEGCDVLLAILAKQWLTLTGDAGRRRLDDEKDFVRFEIETALWRAIPIIPVLVDQTEMPTEGQLPVTMRDFAKRQAERVRTNRVDFGTDINRLITQLNRLGDTLVAIKDEQEKFRSFCDSGDWLLARTGLEAALARDDLRKTPRVRVLEEFRELAERLEKAARAFERSDFKAALTELHALAGPALPASVVAASQLAGLGVKLTELRPAVPTEIRAIERQIEAVVEAYAGSGRKVPFEREVRELLQRMLKEAEHQEASRLYDSGAFDTAAVAFETLGDYKDARERLARCRVWLGALDAVRERDWENARRRLRPLAAKDDEPRARSAQRWCVLARQFVPILEDMAAGGAAPELNIPWEDGRSPYAVLRVGPATTPADCNELSYRLQEKAGGMTDAERASWDALRLVEKRLLVDFTLYTVRDPARVRAVLARYFTSDDVTNSSSTLQRIGSVIDGVAAASRPFHEQLAAELGDDGGVLHAVAGNHDAAIERFADQARRCPHDFFALHHLGLAACAKAHLDEIGDWWDWVCVAWGAVFADNRFWRAWWAQRIKVYPVPDEEQVQAARLQLQRYWTEELKTVGKDREIAQVFRIELNAARSVAARGGIPVGRGANQRAIVGPRGIMALGLAPQLADWIRAFSDGALSPDGPARRVCIAFSSLASAQALFEDGRHQEAIELLSRTPATDDASFADANPGFASVASGRSRILFSNSRSAILQQARMKVALTAVSEVPVDVDKAVTQWKEALALARDLGVERATLAEIRDVLVGRCHVLRNQEHGRLAALNDAVKLLQEGLDQGWDNPEGVVRQALVDALLDRGIHLSRAYDMEKEARQDAQRAWGIAPSSLRAIVVLCIASLHYARDLYQKDERELSRALLKEVEDRLVEGNEAFPGNADLASVQKAVEEIRALLGSDAGTTLEHALDALRATAQATKTEESDSRLAQAMVHETQGDFSRAIELYWALAQQSPGDHGLRGKMGWCYRIWINHLVEQRKEDEYKRVAKEARERCPGSALLADALGPVDNEE